MKIQNSNINFKAGLTGSMRKEIQACDISRIASELSKEGINTDFKNNKLIAWCCYKCAEIIKTLNKQYKLKLGLPAEIIVEDFNKLNLTQKNSVGFANIAPTNLYVGKDDIVKGKTIFFNEFKGFNHSKGNEFWDRIDNMADENFEKHLSATDFFLETFIHEFMHVTHENHLINKFGSHKFITIAQKALTPPNIQRFQDKYESLADNICSYAASNPMETVACDLSKRLIKSIDKNTLTVQNNFMQKSPYENRAFYMISLQKHDNMFKLLKNLWNGKFDFIR